MSDETNQEYTPSPKITPAEYQIGGRYADNPLVQALPPMLAESEFYACVAKKPAYSLEEIRKLSSAKRFEYAQDLFYLFQPLPHHWTLYQDIQGMMRNNYGTRNPLDGSWETEIGHRVALLDPKLERPIPSLRSGLLTGISGMGKTYAFQHILGLFPQLIQHTSFQDKSFPYRQVTWLKLECPADGSPRSLCTAFLQELGTVLGKNYLDKYNTSHASVSSLVPAIGRLALSHQLGLLVIDEVQNLINPNAGTSKSVIFKLLNFVAQIVNTLQVPVLFIGNSNALDFMASSARLARRSAGLRNPLWMRLCEERDEWQVFLKTLWKYCYLRNPTPLDAELKREFYNQTQGLLSCSVRLYYNLQLELMSDKTEESITPELIVDVAKQCLSAEAALLHALRTHDYETLSRIPDIHPVDIFGPGSPEAVKGWPKTRLSKVRKQELERYVAQIEQRPEIKLPNDLQDKPQDNPRSKGRTKQRTTAGTNAEEPIEATVQV